MTGMEQLSASSTRHRFSGRVPAGVDPITPGAGQESVWDYPRPPRVEPVPARVRVVVDGITIADTSRAMRVLETSHPPVYYVPREDVVQTAIRRANGSSVCEWKGAASYWSIVTPSRRIERAAWSYEAPAEGFASIAGHLAFYAGLVDEAWVGFERATAQPGGFYGGWITSAIVGPVKGVPGSWGW
jgi:uncharacterized protein (DUF427 family)